MIKEPTDKERTAFTEEPALREPPALQEKSTRAQLLWRWALYLIGMLALALGIILNTKASLGVSPIISVAYSVSEINHLNFGNVTLLLYTVFVLLEFPIKGKNCKWTDLLQLVVSLVFTRFVNLFNAMPIDPQTMWGKLLVLVAGIALTGIGAAMTVNMDLIPNPGDGIVAAIADRVGKPMGFTKNLFDLLMIAITFLIGLATDHLWLGIGVGTVLAVLGVGRVVAAYNHFFRVPTRRLAGLENGEPEAEQEQAWEEAEVLEANAGAQ